MKSKYIERFESKLRERGVLSHYRTWHSMRCRCLNPGDKDFHRYGGRGITICPEWDDFEQFVIDMGPKPSPGHQLDRKDNDGPYAPRNCRWATAKEQAANRRSSVNITIDGVTASLSEHAIARGIPKTTAHDRYRRGWPIDRVLP